MKRNSAARLTLRDVSAEAMPLCVSVVVPVYNGAATVGMLVDRLIDANPGFLLQIVLVNDGSVDASPSVCTEIAVKNPAVVTFVDLARNVGEHNAVMAGLSYSRGDFCVIIDDDFQNPPEEAFLLVSDAIRNGHDIVFSAYAVKRHHWARNLGSFLTNRIAGTLLRLPRGLYLSSFKALSRFTVDSMLSYRGPFPYVDGLALRTTRKIGVVECAHNASMKGRSTYTPAKLVNLFFCMAVNFSVTPLRLSSALGFIFALSGIAGAGLVTYEKLNNPNMPVGWPFLAVSVLLLSGIQLLMLGVVGEYLGQLLLTVNGTPQYVVRSVVNAKGRGDER